MTLVESSGEDGGRSGDYIRGWGSVGAQKKAQCEHGRTETNCQLMAVGSSSLTPPRDSPAGGTGLGGFLPLAPLSSPVSTPRSVSNVT